MLMLPCISLDHSMVLIGVSGVADEVKESLFSAPIEPSFIEGDLEIVLKKAQVELPERALDYSASSSTDPYNPAGVNMLS